MLVLSRQRDETIMIGDDVMITIVDIRGDKVRLGITAPTKIAVHRKEVYDAIKAENERAAQIAGADLGALKAAFAGPGPAPAARRPLRGASLADSSATPTLPKLVGAPIRPPVPTPTTLRPPMPARLESAG